MVRALVTGASGYIGSRLVHKFEALGEPVGCVARDPRRVGFGPTVTIHHADLLDRGSLSAIGDGYSTAYYLVHSMGRGGDANYQERDASAASNFARFASDSGISRIVYLGGLGDRPTSQHLRSRLRVGEILRDEGGRGLRELPNAAFACGAPAVHARAFMAGYAHPGDRHR